MNQKLGICIPTFKRPEQLELCVNSIIKSASEYKVPIFISDDSSDTTNSLVLARLKNQYPFIISTKNQQNIGIDANILQCVNICTSKFAWLIGEDDRLLPSAVKKVLMLLESANFSDLPFIFSNYASVDDSISIYLNVKVLSIEQDDFETAKSFLENHSWASGFLGGCIINKEQWSSVVSTKYIGTYFAHVGTILEMIYNRNIYLISEPLVLNRCGEPRLFSWTDSMFEVAAGWRKMINKLPAVYPRGSLIVAIRQFEKAHGLYTFRFLCYARADYAYRLSHYKKYIKNIMPGYVDKLIALTIACTPPFVFKSIRFFLFTYRRIKNPSVREL